MKTCVPLDSGIDERSLRRAVEDHALQETTAWDRDPAVTLRRHVGSLLGPTEERGGPCGMVLRHGRTLVSWGDTTRVDMAFSTAKSYLAAVAGVAFDDGLLPDLHEPVGRRVLPELFAEPPHDRITWHHLLTQTSGWRGSLFGRTDEEAEHPGAPARDRPPVPGSRFAYNDVRVNLLAYALLVLHGRSLADVLRERVLGPLGVDDTWSWHGYDTSWVEVGGRRVQSVSGGGHWGGGIWTSAEHDARYGQLMLQAGTWDGATVLSDAWVLQATTPSEAEPRYGYLWWLNTEGRCYPLAPAGSFFANGGNANVIWVWPAGGIVVVARWLESTAIEPLLAGVAASVVDEGRA